MLKYYCEIWSRKPNTPSQTRQAKRFIKFIQTIRMERTKTYHSWKENSFRDKVWGRKDKQRKQHKI